MYERGTFSFNRTLVELKCITFRPNRPRFASFNRTLVELKLNLDFNYQLKSYKF